MNRAPPFLIFYICYTVLYVIGCSRVPTAEVLRKDKIRRFFRFSIIINRTVQLVHYMHFFAGTDSAKWGGGEGGG